MTIKIINIFNLIFLLLLYVHGLPSQSMFILLIKKIKNFFKELEADDEEKDKNCAICLTELEKNEEEEEKAAENEGKWQKFVKKCQKLLKIKIDDPNEPKELPCQVIK